MENLDPYGSETNYNIVALSASEKCAIDLAKSISGTDEIWRGYYVKSYNIYRLITYHRFPDCPKDLPSTAYADAMVVALDKASDFSKVEGYMRARARIPLIIFYSDDDFTEISQTFKHGVSRWVKRSENGFNDVRNMIIAECDKLNSQIRDFFNELDFNKNGVLEKDELKSLASKLGENILSQEFQDMFQNIAHDNANINFSNFLTWWKLGRQNTKLMDRLIKLNLLSKHITRNLPKGFDLENFEEIEQTSAHHYLKISSAEILNPGIQVLLNACFGGDEKINEVGTYFRRFTDNPSSMFARFAHLVFHFKEGTDIPKALESLELLRKTLINMYSMMEPEGAEFVRQFFLFESLVKDNTVILIFRLKLDVQQQFESAIAPFLRNINCLYSNKGCSRLFLDLKTESTFQKIFKDNLKGFEAFKDYSFEIKSDMLRENFLKYLKQNLVMSSEEFGVFSILFQPTDISINVKSKIEDLLIKSTRDQFNVPLGFLRKLIDEMAIPMAKKYFQLITSLEGAEVTFNAQRLFVNLKVHVPGLFD